MKKFIVPVLAILLLTLVGCASEDDGVTTKPFIRQSVIEVPGNEQADLYARANAATVEMFRKAGSVLQYANEDAAIMKGEYTLSTIRSGSYFHNVNVVVTIEVKDEKVRLTFTDLTATYTIDVISGSYQQEGLETFTLDAHSRLDETFAADLDIQAELDNFVDTFRSKVANSIDW